MSATIAPPAFFFAGLLAVLFLCALGLCGLVGVMLLDAWRDYRRG